MKEAERLFAGGLGRELGKPILPLNVASADICDPKGIQYSKKAKIAGRAKTDLWKGSPGKCRTLLASLCGSVGNSVRRNRFTETDGVNRIYSAPRLAAILSETKQHCS